MASSLDIPERARKQLIIKGETERVPERGANNHEVQRHQQAKTWC